jgi:hypothetical protein
MNQPAITQAILSRSGVDANIPESAKHPFSDTAISVRVDQPFLNGFPRLSVLPTSSSSKTLSKFENLFSTPPGFEASFCSWHRFVSFRLTDKESSV